MGIRSYIQQATESTVYYGSNIYKNMIVVQLWGAGGGGGTPGGWSFGAEGGGGGYTYAEIPIMKVMGEKLLILVGEGGVVNGTRLSYGGGGQANRTGTENRYGSNGGGYTGLFLGAISQSSALAIAGGGGGGGSSRAGAGNVGGAGGGSTGQDGVSAYDNKPTYRGRGGTQTSGGAQADSVNPNTTFTAGALVGGTARTNGYGGAGGGGYFGGSAGGYSESNTMGGGGGGSGYLNPSYVTNGQNIQGNLKTPAGTNALGFPGTSVAYGGDASSVGKNGFARITINGITREYSYTGTLVEIQFGDILRDFFFKNTSLLLHGNGTNGAQNNTFLDSSTNNFTITRNGNTTQGAFSPFGDNWSNYFDGSGDTLSTTAVNISSGDFTIESWVYLNAMPTTDSWPGSYSNWMEIIGVGSASLGDGWQFRIGQTVLAFGTNGDTTAVSATHGMSANTWYHLACVRSGNTYTLYVNGSSIGSATYTANAPGTGAFTWIGSETNQGAYLNGYISNLRLVTRALYTSNFIPPTSPLTAVTNTALLTCQSNSFKDNSTNNFSITRTGDVKVQKFNPFGRSTVYDSDTDGGSGYFDGNGDNLTIGSTSAFSISTSTTPFTIECWVYPIADGGCIFSEQYTGAGNPVDISINMSSTTVDTTNGRIVSFGYYTGSAWVTAAIANSQVTLNSWTHVACVFTGSTTKIFYNGVDVTAASPTPATTWGRTGSSGNNWYIGQRWDTAASPYFSGYISNFRFVNGTALYTSTFTPPTTPLTAVTNTALLLNFTNGGIIDKTGLNNLETVGNVQISTTQSKFGGSSLYFDGTGDNLISVTSENYRLGTGDFTIECWLYLNSVTGNQSIIDMRNGTTTAAGVAWYMNTNTLRFYTSGADRIISSALSTGQWYHIAVSRSGTSTKLFVDGSQSGSTYTDTTNYILNNPRIGVFSDGASGYLNGYIDDLRITKGVARYIANFTPPSTQFADF